jgi:hypothetical protein
VSKGSLDRTDRGTKEHADRQAPLKSDADAGLSAGGRVAATDRTQEVESSLERLSLPVNGAAEARASGGVVEAGWESTGR